MANMLVKWICCTIPWQWPHNGEHDGVSSHQPHDYLLNRLFKAQIKNIKVTPRQWPLWGEYTGDRWIPQKSFHLMTELGKFDWDVRYVIIFLYVEILIRLAAVSYRGEWVRTVVRPAVRSVNESRDTRNCVQNGAEYTNCVLFTTRLYYKALGMILCTLICEIRCNYNHLDDDHCDVTGHRKMSALGTAGVMVTTHENSLMMWSFEGPNLFSVL